MAIPLTDTLAMEPRTPYGREASPADAAIHGRIRILRGQKVMLDRDLAELYGVEVKRLKEQVRRNMDRFPEDFMFELTLREAEDSRSQSATLNGEGFLADDKAPQPRRTSAKQGQNVKYAPFAFTEHGILMLANVLRSERAIAVSIHYLSRLSGIIRVFARMREAITNQQEVLRKIDRLEEKVIGHDADLQDVFRSLKQLLSPASVEPSRKQIGYKQAERP